MRRRQERRWRGEAGAELVEMTLTLPLILMVLLAMVDFGLLFQRYEVVNNGAREGARLAAKPSVTDTEVQARVLSYVQASGIPTSAGNPQVVVTPTTLTANGGMWTARQVDVFYSHPYTVMIPFTNWFGGNFSSATLNARATMRLETSVTGLP